MKRFLEGKHTLGLFVTSAEDRYENAIFRGAFDAVKEMGGSLICFTSGAVHSYHGFEAKRNILYDLVTPGLLDGLVISGALGHNISVNEMQTLCQRYRPLPLVSIALPLEGISGLRVDSLGGMRRVVDHLLEVHGKRRIAFIRGPVGQMEAEERFQAYQDGLKAHGVRMDAELVVEGDYTHHSGERAMRVLLEQKKGKFDAVVAANDSMALGAIEVIRVHGMQVPGDIAVTGFDDTDEGRYSSPALTTVRQSPYEQGREATRMLLSQLEQQTSSGHGFASAALVVRQSCGCGLGYRTPRSVAPTEQARCGQTLETQRETIRAMIAERAHLLSAGMPAGWIDLLLDALSAEIDSQRPGSFLGAWQELLQAEAIIGNETVWAELLDNLQEATAPFWLSEGALQNAGVMWVQARLMINEINVRQQAQRRIGFERQSTILRELGETLLTTFNMDSLLDVIAAELPALGVQSCFLSIYENPHIPTGWSRLLLAYDARGRQSLPQGGLRFSSLDLLPAEVGFVPRSGCLVVEALYSRSDQLGFVIFEMQPERSIISGTLRGLLSSALQGIMLLQQRQKIESELRMYQNTLEQIVSSRTDALVETNVKLRMEIEERERAEKVIRQLNADLEARVAERTAQFEAANKELEAFSYSVSHDLRAPLRSVAGFSRIIIEDFADEVPEEVYGYLQRIQYSAHQMGMLIDDLLAFSRLGRHEVKKTNLDVVTLVREVCEEMETEYEGRQVNITVGDLPPANADRALLARVYVNLIGNAIKYTRYRDVAEIEVGCSELDGQTVYFVKDNGAGFNMSYADKLFGVFQRLHRQDEFEGTGVGLATVKRIVERHDGRIWAEAEEDKGATFYFTLGKE